MPDVCNGCGRLFPLMDTSGTNGSICTKCTMLSDHSRESASFADIQSWPQCSKCGRSFPNMQPVSNGPQICESTACFSQPNPPSGSLLTSTSSLSYSAQAVEVTSTQTNLNTTPRLADIPRISEAQAIRNADLRERFRQSPSARNIQPGTQLTTADLRRLEPPTNIENHINVCWQYRLSTKAGSVSGNLGSGTKMFSRSTYIQDVLHHILAMANLEWVKTGCTELQLNEISLRFAGNTLFDQGTSTKTLGEFYSYYAPAGSINKLSSMVPTRWKGLLKNRVPLLCVEGFIHMDIYRERCNTSLDSDPDIQPSEASSITQLSKRRRRSSSADPNYKIEKPKKQVRAQHSSSSLRSISVGSMFKPTPTNHIRAQVQKVSKVMFTKIICTMDINDGQTSFNELNEDVSGYLGNEVFAKGTMKNVYKLLLKENAQEVEYVAKRFFRLNDSQSGDDEVLGSPQLDIEKHNAHIQSECSRLLQAKWFLKSFYHFCQTQGVSVDNDIAFADAFILQEDANANPSIASGALKSLGAMGREGVMWLVEKRRPLAIQRFSGTLYHHTGNNDLRSSTIYAFTHYAFGHSNSTMVFADIQGTPFLMNNHDGMMLFDPMTHTVNGNSGIGDFGISGMNKFVTDHKCRDICSRLALDIDVPLRKIRSSSFEEEQNDSEVSGSEDDANGDGENDKQSDESA